MRLDILSRVSLTFFLIVCAFTLHWQLNFALFLFLILVGTGLTASQTQPISNRKIFWRFLLYALAFVGLITILNGILLQEGDLVTSLFGMSFYDGGLQFGLKTAARLAVLSTTLLLFFLSTPTRELIHFLQQAGLPSPLVLILFLTLHFLGQLPSRINQIFIAQEARGAPVRATIVRRTKAFFIILSPLILSSIVETLERGAALEARGFRGQLRSTKELLYTPASVVISLVVVAFAIVLIVWRMLR